MDSFQMVVKWLATLVHLLFRFFGCWTCSHLTGLFKFDTFLFVFFFSFTVVVVVVIVVVVFNINV